MRVVQLLLLIVIACTGASSAVAGERSLEAARARWETLTPNEQARLRERFDRLRSMPERDRAVLVERARTFTQALRRVEDKLAPEDRARIQRLDPERRRALLHDLALVEGGERFAKAHGSTPEAWRARFEQLPAEERARLLGEMREKVRRHGREKVGEFLARKFDLSREELVRIEALPEDERVLEIMRLQRAANERRSGRPDGQYAGVPRPDEEGRTARRRVFEAGRPRSEDHLRYAERTPAERRELVTRIARERVIATLREHGLATEAELMRLDTLGHEEFRRAIRERYQAPRGEPGSQAAPPGARDR